ncbi:hypothetical protein FQR65_LT02222 [Abscondita terminalis]|nr:hypothetical protein FQR65_LT02222 [Abscondita terminalis]
MLERLGTKKKRETDVSARAGPRARARRIWFVGLRERFIWTIGNIINKSPNLNYTFMYVCCAQSLIVLSSHDAREDTQGSSDVAPRRRCLNFERKLDVSVAGGLGSRRTARTTSAPGPGGESAGGARVHSHIPPQPVPS